MDQLVTAGCPAPQSVGFANNIGKVIAVRLSWTD
jgi:hypothetical protein